MKGGEAMRVIYMRLLISGALAAAMLAFGSFVPQQHDVLTAAPPVSAAGTGQ